MRDDDGRVVRVKEKENLGIEQKGTVGSATLPIRLR